MRTNESPDEPPSAAVHRLREGGVWNAIPSRDTITLSDLLTSVRRHAVLVIGAALATSALAGWLVFREAPTYRATAMLRLTDARRSMTRELGEEVTERPQTINPLLSQIQLLKSRALIGNVVDSEGLRLRPSVRGFSSALLSQVHVDPAVVTDTFFLGFSSDSVTVRNGGHETRVPHNAPYRTAGISFAVRSKPTVDRTTLVLSPREKTIDRFLDRLRVSSREETDVVDVSYADDAPELAQRVVNTLVRTFQDVDVRKAQGQSRRRRVFLEEQLREVTAQLEKSESALASFRSNQQAFSSRDKLQAQQATLTQLDLRQGELDADRRMYESLLGRLQTASGERNDDELRALISAPGIGSNPVVAQIYQQLTQYQTAHDSLTTGQWRSSADNPDVTRLDQLIAASAQRLVGAVRGQIATLNARRDALAAMRERNAAAAAALPRTESAEEQLSRQVESNRVLADGLKRDYQKARMAEEVEAGQVEIVDLASLPYRPVPRLGALRLLLGVMIGLAIGVVGAALIDSRRAHIRGRPDLEEEMRLPVLSVIPPISILGKDGAPFTRLSALLHRVGRLGSGQSLGDGSAAARRGNGTTGLMTPDGAEAFRLLRSSLNWIQRAAPGKTLAVSSALPNEGKTTAAANLAVVYAFAGKRVLLIDCDLRRPKLHHIFGVPRQPGLAQVLRAGLGPAAAIRDTHVERVSLLPAGSNGARFADLLGSDRMRSLLDDLSEHFDMLVLDTPPVLAVADAAAIAPLADGVLLVVGAGTTNRYAVEQALKQLESVGAHVVGAVLNDAHGEKQRSGGEYEYYYPHQDEYASSAGSA